jgi:DNA mismatch repair protein MutS
MSSADTPLMKQYLAVKDAYPDHVVLFRLGDFYEMFFEDAVVASQTLDLVLTTRDKNKDDAVPMCGVPHHAVRGYIARLVEAGFKIAVCEQMEDPRQAKGIVKRSVTEVITPGIILDPDQLEAKQGNYLLALARVADGALGIAYLDASTGEFLAAAIDPPESLDGELARVRPRQVLLAPGDAADLQRSLPALAGWRTEPADAGIFATPDEDRALLATALAPAGGGEPAAGGEVRGVVADATALPPATLAAAAALVRSLGAALPGRPLPPLRLVVYAPSAYVTLDAATLTNLEVFESSMERRRQGSLLAVIDHTVTAMGGRLLRRSLAFPLADLGRIRDRQDAVAALLERDRLRADLRDVLKGIHDLERLGRRCACGLATPRDLGQLRRSLLEVPRIAAVLSEATDLAGGLPALLRPPADDLADLAGLLAQALVDDPPLSSREGGIVRPGHSPEVDALLALGEGGKEGILAIEERERARTGIGTLKIRFNKVFGYTIEVSRAKAGAVPADYVRKQTLANVERYITPELAEYETRVLTAEEQRVALEERIFEGLRQQAAAAVERLGALGERLATCDLVAAFAEAAARHDYVRPEVDDGDVIDLRDGRHPVVEQLVGAGRFVPNDVILSSSDEQLVIVTGPNMAGKSTIIRQVALITLLSHTGSFVPARSARVGRVDRIFTRVGASDNLARGQSTFMVEMRETANILRHATSRSLVVLDEIGRGTATYDGVSIAWAVAEHLHDRIRCKTMFATHFHELCSLADVKPRVRNRSVAVRELRGDVVFLHKLVEGGASRSHGIQVGKLAGLPPEVVQRATQILALLEQRGAAGEAHGVPVLAPQLQLFGAVGPAPTPAPAPDVAVRVRELLADVDPDRLSPREAHALVYELVAASKPG